MDRRADLAALLETFPASDDAERQSLDRVRELLGEPGDPFDPGRHHPGHVTASAFVLHPDGGRLLLIFHRKLQRWLQPGGHVEPSDPSVRAAAVREVEEETGLSDIEVVGDGPFDVDVHGVAHDGILHEHFDVRFLVRARGEPEAGDGVDAVRWAGLGDLGDVDESVLRPARKALGVF
jgi:8-oxo-dGTP pyrophosphatase MutT (NUDIX family)